MERLEYYTKFTLKWFENNYMKLNEVKCHLLAGCRYEAIWAQIKERRTWESTKEKLLGLIIDRNLNFDDHVFTLCGKKHPAFATISRYMSFEKKRILLKAFEESQLWYCPLT